jgi:mannan endo-1,4-beta-mannosidase
VLDDQIYTPDGQPFIARGINIRNDQLNAAVSSGQLLSAFPGLNMVRLYFEGSFSDDLSSIQASINALTAKGVVVAIEDHTGISKAPYTGSQLAAEQTWYAQIASANKTNPYVWFGTFNEPGQGTNLPGIAAQEQATYNTIRGTGNNSPILMEEPSGGNPGLVGANAHGYDGSVSMASGADYGSMTNIVWDLHYYGWVSKHSTSQSTVNAALQGSASGASGILGAQTIQSADGTVPVIIGEFGNSTTGGDIDPNGDQVIKAVTQSGLGYLAWGWDPDPIGDRLTNGSGALTGYGQQIAKAIASGPGASSVCAVSAIPTAVTAPALASGSAAVTAPALTPAATAVTAPMLASAPLTIDQVAAIAVSGQ